MAKKKDNPGMTPDLFADFGAPIHKFLQQLPQINLGRHVQ